MQLNVPPLQLEDHLHYRHQSSMVLQALQALSFSCLQTIEKKNKLVSESQMKKGREGCPTELWREKYEKGKPREKVNSKEP